MVTSSKVILSLIGLLLLSSCGKNEGVSLSSGAASGEPTMYMYLTSATTTGSGKGGLSGADNLCMTDPNYPGTGTYKAMIVSGSSRVACTTANCSGGTAEHVDWVLEPDMSYVRLDDTLIGKTNENGIFTSLSAVYAPSWTSRISTGLKSDWTNYSGNCTNWTSNSGIGGFGLGNAVNSTAWGQASAGVSCSTPTPLVCVEQ